MVMEDNSPEEAAMAMEVEDNSRPRPRSEGRSHGSRSRCCNVCTRCPDRHHHIRHPMRSCTCWSTTAERQPTAALADCTGDCATA